MKVRKIVLKLPLARPELLEQQVLDWVASGIELIWVFGEGANELHDEIDWIMILSGADPNTLPVTSASEVPSAASDLSFEEVLELVEVWKTRTSGDLQIVSF